MIGKSFSGSDTCYVCGRLLNWTKPADPRKGQASVFSIPDVKAEVYAIGRNENGDTKFEIECLCPQCRTTNKFYKEFTV